MHCWAGNETYRWQINKFALCRRFNPPEWLGSSCGVRGTPRTPMEDAEDPAGEQLGRQHAGVQVLAGRLGQRTAEPWGNAVNCGWGHIMDHEAWYREPKWEDKWEKGTTICWFLMCQISYVIPIGCFSLFSKSPQEINIISLIRAMSTQPTEVKLPA